MFFALNHVRLYTKICRHSYTLYHLGRMGRVAVKMIRSDLLAIYNDLYASSQVNKSAANRIKMCDECLGVFENIEEKQSSLRQLAENYEDIYAPGASLQSKHLDQLVVYAVQIQSPEPLMDKSIELAHSLAKTCESWMRLSSRKQVAAINSLMKYSPHFYTINQTLPRQMLVPVACKLPCELVYEIASVADT